MDLNRIEEIKDIMCNDLPNRDLDKNNIFDYCLECAKFLVDNLEISTEQKELALNYLESLKEEDYKILESKSGYDRSSKEVTPELKLSNILMSVRSMIKDGLIDLYGANQMAFRLIEGTGVTEQSVDFLDKTLKSMISK